MLVQYFFNNQAPAHFALVTTASGTEVRCYSYDFDVEFAKSQDVSYEVEYYEIGFALLASFIYEHDAMVFSNMRDELENLKFDLEHNLAFEEGQRKFKQSMAELDERIGEAKVRTMLIRMEVERREKLRTPFNNIVKFSR